MHLTSLYTIVLLVAGLAAAQFQFFDQFFGQQQGGPHGGGGGEAHKDGRGTLAHGGEWYQGQFTGSHCAPGEFVCPSTLECVSHPHKCACPHDLVKCDLSEGASTCVSKASGKDVCAEVRKMHAAL